MQLCDFTVGDEAPLFFIAGPCVIETETLILDSVKSLQKSDADANEQSLSKKLNYRFNCKWKEGQRRSRRKGCGRERGGRRSGRL